MRIMLLAARKALGVAVLGVLVITECAAGSPAASLAYSPKPPVATLPCEDALAVGNGGPVPAPEEPAQRVFFGRVALPTGMALQAIPSSEEPNAGFFAKSGLTLRAGATFELVVPERWRNRLSIRWAGTGNTHRLRVADCGAPAEGWLAFPGGYVAREPACVPITVKAAGRTARAHIGIGVPCRGQRPVPDGVPNFDDFS